MNYPNDANGRALACVEASGGETGAGPILFGTGIASRNHPQTRHTLARDLRHKIGRSVSLSGWQARSWPTRKSILTNSGGNCPRENCNGKRRGTSVVRRTRTPSPPARNLPTRLRTTRANSKSPRSPDSSILISSRPCSSGYTTMLANGIRQAIATYTWISIACSSCCTSSILSLPRCEAFNKRVNSARYRRNSAASGRRSVRCPKRASVFDAERLKEIIAELSAELKPLTRDARLQDIDQTLVLVDGSLITAFPAIMEASWRKKNSNSR